MFKKLLVALAILASVLVSVVDQARLGAQSGAGAVSMTSLGVPVGENFDTLIATGTATWTNDGTLPGWYHARTGTGTTIVANNGGSNAGNLYSYGTGTSSERALGSVGSGNVAAGNFHWGVRLANETGATITSLTVSYLGEQWRNGAAPEQTINFSYRIGTGLGGTLTDFTTGGVAVPELDFASPVTGGTAAAIDGNVNAVPISFTITGLNLAPQQEILLRWSDIDHSGADHGLAVDDVSVTPHGGGVVVPSLSIDNVSVMEGNSGTVNATFTVTASTADHTGIRFDIETADGTGVSAATAGDGDYLPRQETEQLIAAGTTSYTFTVVVNGDTNVEFDETFIVNLTGVNGATVADGQGIGTITNDDAPPPVASDVVISQVYGGGGNTDAPLRNDFIELFNRGTSVVNLTNWSVQYSGATTTGAWSVTPLTGSIGPGMYYLVQQAAGANAGAPPLPTPDATGTIAMGSTAGKVALVPTTTAIAVACPAGGIVDLVGYGGANCFEGVPTVATSNTTAALRKRGGCFDSDNNRVDFSISGPTPRNSTTPFRSCVPLAAPIHDIQGSGLSSPLLGHDVITNGIVTGVKSNGFFLQAPASTYDADPATSEALFVFTSSIPAVMAGDEVSVLGTATEFFGLTQLESSLPGDVTVVSQGNGVPAAVTLTTAILDPAGTQQQLERFEGMRMQATTLVSVAPTDEFGEIATVLPGVARPMRAPGIPLSDPVPPDPTTGLIDCCIPRFDENPERIFLDTEGLVGSTVLSVTSNVAIGGVVGPLDFSFGAYKVLPEVAPTRSPNMTGVPVPAPAPDEFTVGGFNIENFAGDTTRLRKAALAIRQLMRSPDVIGHIEILDEPTLQALADQVNSDAVAAGEANPNYQARLIVALLANGNPSPQNVGFLVKTSRVRIDSVIAEPAGTFTLPGGGSALLHDRPPLVLRATVDPFGANPRPVIVVVNHLRSFIDIDLVDGDGPRVRAKRTAQAEAVAQLLQDLQTENPGTAVISIGDYNAYEFNDGYTDPIAIIKGSPTPDDQIVVDDSPDLVNPNFVNLTDGLPSSERYSFLFEGTPQALDHVLVNTVALSYVQRYAIARGNSDFPNSPEFTSDATRPERSSDHDMPVAYFRFPPPTADLAVSITADAAMAAAGASVTYTVTVTNNGEFTAQNVVVSAGGTNTIFATLAAGASEVVTFSASISCAAPNGSFAVATATVASDTSDPNTANNSASASVTVSNAAPVIGGLSASRTSLLLPLHQMVPVTVNYTATDTCGAVTTTLTVTSDEPVTAPVQQQGLSGLTSPDWVVMNAHVVQLRAERSLRGDGRVYTISVVATDAAGESSTAQITVTVPRHINGFFDK